MNVAGVFKLPLVMVVQNNQWAIFMPRSRQTASQTLAQKALAYGIDAMQVDGNDLLAMIVASREAVHRARNGGGPMLIEALTYRLGPHSTSDDPRKYRDPAEVKPWENREPLLRFRKYLELRGVLVDGAHSLLEAEIDAEIAAEVQEAEACQTDELAPFHHCFAEMPDHLRAQLREFAAYLSVRSGEAPASVRPAISRGVQASRPPRTTPDRLSESIPSF